MVSNKHVFAAVLCSAVSLPVTAADEVEQIRDELEQLREGYESRIRQLEKRLDAAESAASENQVHPRSEPVGASVPGGRRAASGNAFNPAVSAIVQAKISRFSEDPGDAAIPGFQIGGEAGLPPEGFSLDETEIVLSANVDQLFYGEITIGLHEEEEGSEIDVEEAFFDTLALPAGLGVRGGRFYSGIGYLNRFHSHAWDFHDAPLVYRAFLGDQYRDDGVRLNWLAPTDLYINLGVEMLQGNTFPGGGSDAAFGDSRTAFIHVGGDLNASNSWRAGLSGLWMDSNDRAGGGHGHGDEDAGTRFSGDSDLLIADAVWKWAPHGNPRYRNLTFTGEYFFRREDGAAIFTEDGALADLDYDGEQQGFYAQAVYQFMPRWRAGLRYDWLDSDNDVRVMDAGGLDTAEVLEESGLLSDGEDARRWSLMADYSPSEFSRVRLQYNHDDSRTGTTDHQWVVQYIMSIGAHGAHEY